MRTVFLDVGPLAHLSGDGAVAGDLSADVSNYVSPAGSGIVVIDGVIERIAASEELLDEYGMPTTENDLGKEYKVVSLNNNAVIPGFVDGHTHLLWAGDRSRELSWRHEGKTYRQISELGGGIQDTVRSTSEATDEHLIERGYERMRNSLRSGTTHMETKSGYGLTTESELRLLRIAAELQSMKHLPTLDLTWLGAHDVPSGMTSEQYVEQIMSEQLPSVLDQGLARSADVFCEPGWFNVEQSEDIMKASRQGGLDLRMHIDEFKDGGGGGLAADLCVDTADHAHYTNSESRLRMKESGVMTGFLPGTPYAMGSKWPSFNKALDDEIPWSIATDYNPNCKINSMTFLGSLLVQRCGIHPMNALMAATRNPAETTPHPSGMKHGRIEVGAVANFNVLNSEYWEAWCLQPSEPPIHSTCLNGNYIHH
ncbi:amidohydrolase family protein [Euryarchaeota archaeon]|nr:amidohydrolase family protein [Euryarchaeota archaeon]